MTSLDEISTQIQFTETLIQQIHQSFQTLESHHPTIISIPYQCRNLLNSFTNIQSSLNNLAQELESKEESIELSKKAFVCDRCKTLASYTGNVVVKIEPLHEKESINGGSLSNAVIRFNVTMDGKTLQMFLNDRVNEHELMADEVFNALKLSNNPTKLVFEAMEGFFAPHLRGKGGVEYEGDVVRRSCVVLLEQFAKMKVGVRKKMRDEVSAVAREWREKMRAGGESYLVVLGFLMFLVVFNVGSGFDKDELDRLCRIVLGHRMLGQIRLRLGLLEKWKVSDVASQIKEEQPGILPATISLSRESTYERHFMDKTMDTNRLRSFLTENFEDLNSFHEKALNFLNCASDPAKIVFDFVQEIYLELDGLQGDMNKSCSCIFLLEQLMKLSPDISPPVREAAMNLAIVWKERFPRECRNPSHVFGFLKFLAAYGLASSFEAPELLSLFSTFYNTLDVYELDQNRSLCRALGLEIKVPDLILSLIVKNQRLAAVRIICAFNLVDKFPPVPLLEAHLDYVKRNALMTCVNFKKSIKAQKKCANRQIFSLQGVIKCISDFKLESEYSPICLQQRIKQLEEERGSLKCSPGESRRRNKRAICSATAIPNQLQEKRQETHPNSLHPAVSVTMKPNMQSVNPASQCPGQQFITKTSTWQPVQFPGPLLTEEFNNQVSMGHGSSVPDFGPGLASNFHPEGSFCSITPTVNHAGLPYNYPRSSPHMPAPSGGHPPVRCGQYGLQYLYPPSS